jgi:hypothetical protein
MTVTLLQIRSSRANCTKATGSNLFDLGTYSGRVELIHPGIYGDNIGKQRHFEYAFRIEGTETELWITNESYAKYNCGKGAVRMLTIT